MGVEPEAAVSRRLAEARRRLWRTAAEGDELARLKAAAEEVSLLADLNRQPAARRWRWVFGGAFALLLLGGALHLVRLPVVDVAVAATTRHLVLSSGETSEVVLEGVSLEAVSVDAAAGPAAWCAAAAGEASGCRPVDDLVLNGLTFHPRGRFGLSQAGGCLELEVHEGGMSFDLSFLSPAEPFGVGQPSLRLAAGDAATVCGTFADPFVLARPRRLVLGRESPMVAVRPVTRPALVDGVVVLASIGREHRLLPTEALVVSELSDGFVTVEMGDAMKVSLSGVARSLSSTRGGVAWRDLRPTLLAWVTRVHWIQGLVALIGGVFGLVVAFSDWLGKLGFARPTT